MTLLTGTRLSHGRRTVCAALRLSGEATHAHWSLYHQVLNRARWSPLAASRCLLWLIVDTLLPPDAPIDHAIETLLHTSQSEFPVLDGTGGPAGVLGRSDLIRALKQFGPDARVADVMTSPVPTVGHRACLEEAFQILQEQATPAVGVVDASGQLVGLITSETIGEMLMVRDALPKGAHLGPWSLRPGRRTT